MARPLLFVAALLSVAACDADTESRRADPPATSAEQPAQTAPFATAGAATTLQPDTSDNLQQAAAVTEVVVAPDQGGTTVKLFGTAGGDPAMNGLYTHIAFFISPAEGWRVFRLGDFLGFKVVHSARGRVDLEITESTFDEASSAFGSRTRRLIVGFTLVEDGSVPATVTITPAQ